MDSVPRVRASELGPHGITVNTDPESQSFAACLTNPQGQPLAELQLPLRGHPPAGNRLHTAGPGSIATRDITAANPSKSMPGAST